MTRIFWHTTTFPVSTETIQSQPEKREWFYLVGKFRTLSPGDSVLVALRKLLRKGSQAIYKFCNKGSRQSEHQRSGIKLRNLACYVWEGAGLWTCWIHSFHKHLSYVGPILCPCSPGFLHSPSSSAITAGVGSIHWIAVLGALIHIWRSEIIDGYGISCLLMWQDLFSFHISSLPEGLLSFLFRVNPHHTQAPRLWDHLSSPEFKCRSRIHW